MKKKKAKKAALEKGGIPISQFGSINGTPYISKHRKCDDCGNTGMQMQTSGPRRGDIRMCPACAGNYEAYINQYGTDEASQPELYIDLSDEDSPIMRTITEKEKKANSLILPGGVEVELNSNKRYGKGENNDRLPPIIT